jgi:cytochrome c-type biogenesis protein
LVLLLGLAILMGGDKWLEAQLIHLMPQGWIDLTTRF